MSAASLLLSMMLVEQRQALQVAQNDQQAVVPAQAASAPPTAARPTSRPELTSANWLAARAPQSGYLSQRYIALTRGVAAIETPLETADSTFTPPTERPPTRREMLNELLPTARAMNPKS
jgi:hypothetical protein